MDRVHAIKIGDVLSLTYDELNIVSEDLKKRAMKLVVYSDKDGKPVAIVIGQQ